MKETLATLRRRGGNEKERGFVTHRTMADPRFLDASLEPNDRAIGRCYLGHPETVNNGPVGLARFSTLRAWLSQWSIDDTNAEGERCAARVTVPLLAIENTADDAVPQSHVGRLYEAAASTDKTFVRIRERRTTTSVSRSCCSRRSMCRCTGCRTAVCIEVSRI